MAISRVKFHDFNKIVPSRKYSSNNHFLQPLFVITSLILYNMDEVLLVQISVYKYIYFLARPPAFAEVFGVVSSLLLAPA